MLWSISTHTMSKLLHNFKHWPSKESSGKTQEITQTLDSIFESRSIVSTSPSPILEMSRVDFTDMWLCNSCQSCLLEEMPAELTYNKGFNEYPWNHLKIYSRGPGFHFVKSIKERGSFEFRIFPSIPRKDFLILHLQKEEGKRTEMIILFNQFQHYVISAASSPASHLAWWNFVIRTTFGNTAIKEDIQRLLLLRNLVSGFT